MLIMVKVPIILYTCFIKSATFFFFRLFHVYYQQLKYNWYIWVVLNLICLNGNARLAYFQ